MQKLIQWWDKYVLKFGVLFLLIFIPLFPKIPLLPQLFDIRQTWQYIRLDDIVVALLAGIFVIETIKRRTTIKSPLSIPIVVYWIIGALSVVHALLFMVGTVPHLFSHLVIFHYLRRIEYLILFFISFSSIKSKKDVQHYIFAFLIAFIAIMLYGYGQKLLPATVPAFPTMNEEFAKGDPIYLDTDSRIISSFAGHYDLAAYLVFTLAIIGSFFLGLPNAVKKISLAVLGISGLVLMMFTKSRVSFSAFIVSIIVLLLLHKKKWLIAPLVVLGFASLFFGGGLSDRFGKTVRVEPVVYQLPQEKPLATLEDFIRVTPTPYEELPLGSGYLDAPFLERFGEPYTVELINYSEATSSAVPLPRTYLVKQTMVYDISLTTRIQGQWPRAVEALKRNILLGSGYSALGAATDGDYFRMLGETGMLGTISFLSIFVLFFLIVASYLKHEKDPFLRSFVIGVSAGLSGLFVNAIFIDIFEASKIAYVMWMTIGVVTALIVLKTNDASIPWKDLRTFFKSTPVAIGIMLLVSILLFYRVLFHHFSGDDFTWLRWAMTTTPSDIVRYFVDSDKFFYRPLTKTVFYSLYQIFGKEQPALYHLTSLVFHMISTFLVYLIVKIISNKRFIAFVASLLFLIHPIHAENIFWVSGLSSVMSGSLYLASVYDMLVFDRTKKWHRWIWYGLSLLSFALALSSYEMSMSLPGILLMYYIFKRKYRMYGAVMPRIRSFIYRAVLPVLPHMLVLLIYLYVRNAIAESYWMQGDYNVNIVKLPFNIVGNSIGYVGELLVGFSAISWYDYLRMTLRENLILAMFVGISLISLLFLTVKTMFKNKNLLSSDILMYTGWFFISLVPALGLGNIAERYLYVPSVGGVGIIAVILYKIGQRSLVSKIVASILLGGLISIYTIQLSHAKETWRQAGTIAHNVIESVSEAHVTFPDDSTLYFINIPLRVERAWVFPVGLDDAIWLTYQNDAITVETGLDLETALKLKEKTPNSYVFVYNNDTLQEIEGTGIQEPLNE
ncbi:hypothetical protein A3A55_00015 [Candidatus Roizmanbacteria bacterium RIFCSPLOWO2_01_FULL_40_14]|nr:MAG: hypothetical protein UT85_C0001G0003 [Candidatus Levybacteria bacterium GW2011_GWA2_40_16]OGK49053.1 MAG: hypothetical protein A3A55_00015 [Candidatus Roizmanbacteria bacterium RIFCSPLOWO2_01_FULL_40_14]